MREQNDYSFDTAQGSWLFYREVQEPPSRREISKIRRPKYDDFPLEEGFP